jgi:hypothetical protein
MAGRGRCMRVLATEERQGGKEAKRRGIRREGSKKERDKEGRKQEGER